MIVILPWPLKQYLRKNLRNSLRTQCMRTHLLRGLAGWLCFYTFYAALHRSPLVDTSLLRNTAPLFVPLVAWLWVRAKIPPYRWIPIVLGFIGIALILRPQTLESGLVDINIGHVLGLLSGITLAASMVGTRVLSRTENEKKIMFYYFLISLLCSIPLGIYHWQPIPLWTLPFLLYIGLSIFLAMWLYTKAFSYAKASIVSPITYFAVVVSGFLGWLIWDHIPSSTALQGVVIVMTAGALTVYFSAREPEAEDQAVR